MTNELAKQAPQKMSFSMRMNSAGFQKSIMNTLQDKNRAARFTASIVSAVSNTPALQECDASTILSGALLGESLNLSPSPQLGQFYLVPFKDRKNNRVTATFVLGYKGYVQLALRSGYYKKLNVLEIKEGELVSYDPLNETIEVNLIQDDKERSQKKSIGYYAFFEYSNGFQKMMYWSREKMEAHAETYSAGYKAKKGYTYWEKDFDGMAKKTMLRQIISKWGIMSTELEQAIINDDQTINQNDDGFFEAEPIEVEEAPMNAAQDVEFEQVSIDEL